jgi:hypothetical protein
MSEPAVLQETRLDFEYVGPAAKSAKGWAVTDAAQQLVATVPQPTGFSIGIPNYPLVDAAGTQLAVVVPGEQQSHTHWVFDGAGQPIAYVGKYDGDWERTSYELLQEHTTLARIQVGTNATSVTGVTISDSSGQEVATIAQNSERISFLKGRTWFTLERNNALSDPLRLLTVAAPLIVHLDLELRELRANTGRVQRDWHPI